MADSLSAIPRAAPPLRGIVAARRVLGVLVVAALLGWSLARLFWPANEDIVPAGFRGVWVDPGADCDDPDARLTVTRNTLGYDRLSFIAADTTDAGARSIVLHGLAFPRGDAVRATVRLAIDQQGSRLLVVSSELGGTRAFARCHKG